MTMYPQELFLSRKLHCRKNQDRQKIPHTLKYPILFFN
jgi:hypothetical protein